MINEFENLEKSVFRTIESIVNNKKNSFQEKGFILEVMLNKEIEGAVYESDVTVSLRSTLDVVEIMPIQIVYYNNGAEPMYFVELSTIKDVEKEVIEEMEKWAKEYLTDKCL